MRRKRRIGYGDRATDQKYPEILNNFYIFIEISNNFYIFDYLRDGSGEYMDPRRGYKIFQLASGIIFCMIYPSLIIYAERIGPECRTKFFQNFQIDRMNLWRFIILSRSHADSPRR